MKIMSLNVNGLRSAERHGFFEWLHTQDVDIVCLQETKIQDVHFHENASFSPQGYFCDYVYAQKKGYSGVAIYSKQPPQRVIKSLDYSASDEEGRYIQFDFEHFSVASIYFPSGTSGDLRQSFKMGFLKEFEKKLNEIKQSGKSYILCGDYNIAHRQIDLKNWRANQKNTGFLPEERAWLDQLFGDFGFVDALRVVRPEDAVYTWWSYRARAWEKDVGWRIDYQVVTPDFKDKIVSAEVKREPRFSDHAPLIIEYA